MSTSRLLVRGVIFSLILGGIAAFQRLEINPVAAESSRLAATPFVPPPIAVSPTATPSFPPALTQSIASTDRTYPAHRILTCNGQPAGANFRAFPSLAPSAILGAVDSGQTVQLTGRTTIADGITWHAAIAPALVFAVTPGAQNRLEPNQTGWIADCFVRG